MSLPSPKICRRIRGLFARMGSTNANEAASAHKKLVKALADQALSWNDIPDCIAAADEDDRVKSVRRAAASPSSSTAAGGPEVNVLELVLQLSERHVAITPEERMAHALWVLHSYVFNRYDVTPRLALL